MHRLLIVLGVNALLLPAADKLFDSAIRKLDLIETGKAAKGSTIVFTTAEIDAWARVRIPEIVPEGIRNQHVELGYETANGFALMDFLKMRHAKGQSTNWIVSKLIEGERPVKVSIRLQSAAGRCTVFLTRVEMSNAVANGTVLDFLIKTFFMPLYPDAKINEPFDLEYNMDRIDIRPSGVRVTMKR